MLNREFLIKEYIENKKSIRHIALIADCSIKTVHNYLIHFSIPRRDASQSKKGIKNPIHIAIRMSKEMLQWNQRVLIRDNFTCQECGQIGKTLEVHHKKPFNMILKEFLEMNSIFSPIEDKETLIRLAFIYPDFWDSCNGITLCEKCHEKIPCKPTVING